MEQINLPEFLSLFGYSSIDDCWLNTDCVIDKSGITAKYSDDDSTARLNYSERVKLSLPCTAQDLFYWAKGLENQGYFVKELPKWFVDKWLPNYMLFRVWCSQTDTVKGVGTDMPFDVDWVYWLNFSEYWTKKEAALLIFGLEPNQFKLVDINENDLTMCELLYKLLRLPDDLKLRPYDWLKWLCRNGYLELAQPLKDKIVRYQQFDSTKFLEQLNKEREEKEKREGDEADEKARLDEAKLSPENKAVLEKVRSEWQFINNQLDDAISRKSEAPTVQSENSFNYGFTKTILRKSAGAINSKNGWQGWLDLPVWTPEQAICLLYEINPFDYCKIESNEQIKMLKLRANFKGNMTPYQWQQFFNEQQLHLPRPLSDIQKPSLETQAEAVVNDGAGSQDGIEPASATKPRRKWEQEESSGELKQGLREIWEKEDRPDARLFFPTKLKKYINTPGSPVTAVYPAGKDAGIGFKLSTGTTGHRTKKTISNYVSIFKKMP